MTHPPPASRAAGPQTPGDHRSATRTARTRVAVAPLNAEPRAASTQISQTLFGWTLTVLAEQGDWLHVAGDDGYEGWLHRGYAEPHDGTAPASSAAPAGQPAAARISLGCSVHAGGRRRELPLGALLDENMTVDAGDAVTGGARARRFPRDARAIVESAVQRFAGTSYEWGGLTPWGADCSGLVQSVFRLHGVLLPRDAWQQALQGEDAGRDLARLEPADLLFFSDRDDGRITHVGIAAGDGSMVHLGLGRGGYAIEQLGGRGDDYQRGLRERFRFARRLAL